MEIQSDPLPVRRQFRVRYTKTGRSRYLSGTDLARFFDRATRRAGLPVAMSQGFNPRPRIAMLSALGVGTEGLDEVLDIVLRKDIPKEEFITRLSAQMPEGLTIREAFVLHDGAPKTVERIAFSAHPLSAVGVRSADVENLLAQTSLPVERKSKRGMRIVDIRPFIESIAVRDDCLCMTFRVMREGTTRPEEILHLLGVAGETIGGALSLVRTKVEITHR